MAALYTLDKIHQKRRVLSMTKEALMHSNAFQPEELSAVKAVYDDIVAQEWFDQSEEAKASFGRYLIETYSLVVIEPARFRTIVECSARTHYSCKR